jgi:RND family efflux transporter MFP subunit
MTPLSKVLIGLASVAVLGAGVAGTAAMVLLAPTARSAAGAPPSRPVEVIEVELADAEVIVSVTGTVEAARQVALSPEVAGRVVEIGPALRPGGRLAAGDLIVRLDARDYQAALAVDRARLAQAELELALETERQRTADREWALVGGAQNGESLALRRPHLAVAEANARSAAAAVERAEANVSRTRLRAPFDAIVVQQSAEVGQMVGSQAPVATLVGTDEARVIVSVPVDRLAALDIPGLGPSSGSLARVRSGALVRDGEITGIVGQLDPQTRTAQVVVRIADPLDGPRPLLPGSFVDVELVGRPIGGAAQIPRVALVGDEVVWLAVDGKLARRPVTVGWRAGDHVYVVDGLADGDRVIVSPLSLPIEGQPVSARARAGEGG